MGISKKDDKQKIRFFREGIKNWGKTNLRNFPWRETDNLYNLIIAEIFLHRTNVKQVEPIYKNFIMKYKNFESIYEAGSDEIKRELFSLGLKWRAEKLYMLAQTIIKEFKGKIPIDKKKLESLPGIGSYISSAILCFGHNLPFGILDTNTVRVIGRFFGLLITDSSRRKKEYEILMNQIVDCKNPKFLSLSLIDFASIVCSSKQPKCNKCPLQYICCFYGEMDKNEK